MVNNTVRIWLFNIGANFIYLLNIFYFDYNAMKSKKTTNQEIDRRQWKCNSSIRDNTIFFSKNLSRYFKCIFGLTQTKQSVVFSDTILGKKEGLSTAEANEEHCKETRFSF